MGNPDLLKKVVEGIKQTGYPLEQRVGHCLRQYGWIPFHAVTYWEPKEKTQRELDILAYKNIQDRRIELRISCKRSSSKQWVFFTEEKGDRDFGTLLKVLPVSDNRARYLKIPAVLARLPFFSHDRIAINYTALGGNKDDKDAKSLLRGGLLSSLTSVYEDAYPHNLLFDQRGKIILFVVVFDGFMFESFFDPHKQEDHVSEIAYAQWDTKLRLARVCDNIADQNGIPVPLSDVMYWFSDRFRVEVLTWNHLPNYLASLDAVFSGLDANALRLFGQPWTQKNFPKIVGPVVKFKRRQKNRQKHTPRQR
jgi:hypothetical protein